MAVSTRSCLSFIFTYLLVLEVVHVAWKEVVL